MQKRAMLHYSITKDMSNESYEKSQLDKDWETHSMIIKN